MFLDGKSHVCVLEYMCLYSLLFTFDKDKGLSFIKNVDNSILTRDLFQDKDKGFSFIKNVDNSIWKVSVEISREIF